MAADEDRLAKLVQSRYGEATNAQRSVMSEMELACRFYRGDQWLQKSGNRWVSAPEPKWKVRLTVNKLIPLVELSIATFLRYKPIIIATPGTDERDDRYGAKISEMLLRYFWDELEFDDWLVEMLNWVFVTGSAFVHADWDPTKGKTVKNFTMDPLTGGQIVDPKTPERPEGAPSIQIYDPFSMSVEPGAKKFADAGWCIATEIMRTDQVELRWNQKVDPSRDDDYTQMERPMTLNGEMPAKDRVAVHKMFERPTKKHPKGRIAWTANNKVLDRSELPNGKLRMTHFRGIPLPGELWPSSLVTQVIPQQMELNRGRSQLIENRNLTSRPKMIAPEGSMADDAVSERPGEIIWYDSTIAGAVQPSYLNPPSTPGWVMQILQQTNDDMMDLASRHEASQGASSSNVTSGRQAEMFRSADDSRLAPAVRMFEHGLESLARDLLVISKEKMQGEQLVRVAGKNRVAEIHRFQANDISSNCNIRFEIASQIPWARESLREKIIYLNAQGKIDDEEMFEKLEFPTRARMNEMQQDHRLNARLENEELYKGPIPVMPTDNHNVHLQEHEKEVNLPEQRKFIINAVQEHRQKQQLMPEMKGQQYPQFLQNFLSHMEEHRNSIPPPQPPAPAMKVNVSSRDIAHTEQGQQAIMGAMNSALGEQPGPANQPGKTQGGAGAQGGGAPPPPGNSDGRMYGGTGSQAAQGISDDQVVEGAGSGGAF